MGIVEYGCGVIEKWVAMRYHDNRNLGVYVTTQENRGAPGVDQKSVWGSL